MERMTVKGVDRIVPAIPALPVGDARQEVQLVQARPAAALHLQQHVESAFERTDGFDLALNHVQTCFTPWNVTDRIR